MSRFVLHRLAVLGPAASELARTVAVLGDDCELRLAARVSGLSADAARAAADELVRADILARGTHLGFVHPIVRAALYEDLGPGEREARHAAAAEALAAEGARGRPHHRAPAAHRPDGRPAAGRDPQDGGRRRGAARRAACRRACGCAGRSRSGRPERAEILADLGKSEVAAGSFEAAEEHLREALASDAGVTLRAGAATALGRCAMLSGGSSAEAAVAAMNTVADELESLDPERSLVVRSELLILATIVPSVRHVLPEQRRRFRDQARGDSGFEAVARLHDACELQVRGESAALVAAEVEQALATGLPASAGRNTFVMALIILRFAERYDLAPAHARHRARGRPRGGPCGTAGHHLLPAREDRARAGLPPRRAGGRRDGPAARRGAALQRGPAPRRPDHRPRRAGRARPWPTSSRGEVTPSGVVEDRIFLDEYLVARGRLRIAQGDAERGVADLLWCGERLKALGIEWQTHWRAVAAPALAALGDTDTAERLAEEQLDLARRVGSPAALGLSLRARALTFDGDRRLRGLEEAVAVLEPSAGRLELAHALADLGVELARSRRVREGREASRRAMQLAGECGATALAERARTELQSGPGRPARVELTGPGALTAAEWRVCRQVAEGHTNREVAQAVFITEKTVERHLSSVYQKLGIRSRHQLREAIGEQKQWGQPWGSPACRMVYAAPRLSTGTERIGPHQPIPMGPWEGERS